MENIFLHFLNISITAGWIVLAVIVLRLLLKKAPKWISCLLWAIVGIRLILPFSIESVFSLIPSKTTVDPSIVYQAQPTVNTGIDAVNSMVNPIISSSFAPDPINSANPLQIWTFIAAWAWIIGIGIMLIYTLVSYVTLRIKVGTAVKYEDNIYQSERVASPFILGVIKPKIYLPFKISDEDISHVIAHEQAHLRRRDHLIKPIAFLLLAVYWFNPLMWVAYILLCRDIELACDEKVIKAMADEDRREYSKALLDLSVRRISVAACPLAFGEVGVKARIKSVMSYKKPAFWIIIAALIICIAVSVCFLTDPVGVTNDMICEVIEEENIDSYLRGDAFCVTYKKISTKSSTDKKEIYLYASFGWYDINEQNEVEDISGGSNPAKLTFEKVDGKYVCTEYWTPRDGSYYAKDMENTFPGFARYRLYLMESMPNFHKKLLGKLEAKAKKILLESQLKSNHELSHLQNEEFLDGYVSFRLISPNNNLRVVVESEVDFIKEKISRLIISNKEISQSRAEDRPTDYCIMMYYDIEHYITLNFNTGCLEVWENDLIKPTFTYKVENPEVVKEIFNRNYTDPDVLQYENVEAAILEHNKDAYLKGDVGVCVYRELLTEGKDSKINIYLQVLYGEYILNDDTGDVEHISGGTSPVRLTFEKGESGYYCTEYYEPRDGDLHYKDLKENFPPDAVTALANLEMDDNTDLQAELDQKAEQKLTSVTYYYSDPDNSLKSASVTLWGKDNFQFTYSMLSSNLCMGKYTRYGNKLILREDDSDKVYTFKINDRDLGTIIFDTENSSELPKYKYSTNATPEVCLPDGAEFKTAFEIDATIDAVLDITPIEGVEYSLQINEISVADNSIYVPAGDVILSLSQRISDDVAYKRVEGNYLSTPINEAIVDIDYPYEEGGRDGTTVTSSEYLLKDVPVGRIIHITVTKELQGRLGLGDNVIEIIAVAPSAVIESDMYTENDITSAVAVIEQVMALNWPGCTLKEIYYAGDEKSKKHQDWADRNNADEVIVLLSSFDVDESCPIGSLDKNRTYLGWSWILVRNKGEEWRQVDCGY